MARSRAHLSVELWRNTDYLELTAAAQRLYLLLLSQPDLTVAGTVGYLPARWSQLAADTTVADLEAAVVELETARFVLVDRDTAELALRTFARHDGILAGARGRVGFWRALSGVFSPRLRAEIVAEVLDLGELNTSGDGVTGPSAVNRALELGELKRSDYVAALEVHQTRRETLTDTPADTPSGGYPRTGDDTGKGYPPMCLPTPTPTPTPTTRTRDPVDNPDLDAVRERLYARAGGAT